MKQKNPTYKLLLRPEPEGGYTVLIPSLPGCITYGESIEHAIDMAREAIELYLEDVQQNNEDVPNDVNVLEYTLQL